MHILEIPSFLPPYGGYFCIEQARALQKCGHEVRVINCQQLGVTVYPWHFISARYDRWWEKDGNIEIYRTYLRGIPHSTRHNQQRTCRIINSMFDEYVKRYGKPDVIHAHCCQWAGVAARMISERTNIPFFITEHIPSGIFEANYGKNWTKDPWAKDLLKDTYEKANCVIPVAKELVEDIAPFFGKNYRWQELSNIIDVDFFAFKERESLDGRKYRFCCLAIANKYELYRKGYDVLLKAFRNAKNAELHIAGRHTDGKEMQNLIDSILSEEQKQNVFIHGDLSKEGVRELLYHCDSLVLASRSEVQPLVVMEAMATGIPVVCTEVAPQSERIDGACLISPIGDHEKLAINMEAVKSIQPSKSISEAIKRIASPDTVAEQLVNIFNNNK